MTAIINSRRKLIAATNAIGLGMFVDSQTMSHASESRNSSSGSTIQGIISLKNIPSLKIEIALPAAEPPWPLLIYSHGLGGGLSSGARWKSYWQKAGFICVSLIHENTSDAIFKLIDPKKIKDAISFTLVKNQVPARCKELSSTLDYLLNPKVLLSNYIDVKNIAVAGHSYGALTAMSLAGRESALNLRDQRIGAAIALSPGVGSLASAKTMTKVSIPFMCVTGSLDSYVEIGPEHHRIRAGVPLENRVAVFQNLPRGNKSMLFIQGADHMQFSGDPEESRFFSRAGPRVERYHAAVTDQIQTATSSFLLNWVKRLDRNRPAERRENLDLGHIVFS
jgi:predicted dienelactone hydrolase